MARESKEYGKLYSSIYDIITSHKDYAKEVESLLSFLKPQLREKKILSIGCGTGNHEKIISNSEIKVFGIDISPEMLEKANAKKIINQLEFGLNYNEALKFFGDDKFNCIISLFNCINCLSDITSLKKFISEIYSNLDNESCFFFEAWNGEECLLYPPKIVSRKYKSNDYSITRVAKPKIFFEKKQLIIEYDIFGNIKKNKVNLISLHKIKLFSPDEIINILEQIGFLDIKVFSALPELTPLDKKNLIGGGLECLLFMLNVENDLIFDEKTF